MTPWGSDLPAEVRLAAYLQVALTLAEFEELADEEGIFGRIPSVQGVWSNAPTLDASRQELAEVLADWVHFRLEWKLPIPVVAGINLNGDVAA